MLFRGRAMWRACCEFREFFEGRTFLVGSWGEELCRDGTLVAVLIDGEVCVFDEEDCRCRRKTLDQIGRPVNSQVVEM